jgi:hypothetical protein
MRASKQRNYDLEELFFLSQKCVHNVIKRLSCFSFPHRKIAEARMEKPAVNSGTFSRHPQRLGVAPGTGTRHFRHGMGKCKRSPSRRLFRIGRGKNKNSEDIMLQQHDARTPATKAETTSTVWVSATALTKARAWTPEIVPVQQQKKHQQ